MHWGLYKNVLLKSWDNCYLNNAISNFYARLTDSKCLITFCDTPKRLWPGSPKYAWTASETWSDWSLISSKLLSTCRAAWSDPCLNEWNLYRVGSSPISLICWLRTSWATCLVSGTHLFPCGMVNTRSSDLQFSGPLMLARDWRAVHGQKREPAAALRATSWTLSLNWRVFDRMMWKTTPPEWLKTRLHVNCLFVSVSPRDWGIRLEHLNMERYSMIYSTLTVWNVICVSQRVVVGSVGHTSRFFKMFSEMGDMRWVGRASLRCIPRTVKSSGPNDFGVWHVRPYILCNVETAERYWRTLPAQVSRPDITSHVAKRTSWSPVTGMAVISYNWQKLMKVFCSEVSDFLVLWAQAKLWRWRALSVREEIEGEPALNRPDV